jgi:hypothetical protein
MPHQLERYAFQLPEVEEWLAGDSRILAFQVVDEDGNGVDMTTATISWGLFQRSYKSDISDAVLSDNDSGVDIVTSDPIDPSVGEFEVRIDPAATEVLYGGYYQRPEVTDQNGDVSSWRGRVTVTA